MLSRLRSFFEHSRPGEHLPPEQSLEEVRWLFSYVLEHQPEFLRSHSSYRFTEKLLTLTMQTDLFETFYKRDSLWLQLEIQDEVRDFPGCVQLYTVVKYGTSIPFHTRGVFYVDAPTQPVSQIDMVIVDPVQSIFEVAEKSIPRPKLQEWVDCGQVRLPYHPQGEKSLYFAAGSTLNELRRPGRVGRMKPYPVLTR